MRMYDIIAKKRDGGTLSSEEVAFFVHGCVSGEIPDYQTSALLMAIFLKGMTDGELAALTEQMAHSGDMVDLSGIPGFTVDKHSTGGVGDKTTMIACPIAASCGVKVAKMSGRGLGYTGGTVDKLEAIPGFQTELGREKFLQTVSDCGISMISQSGNLAPADKILYALRDVTATVESIPLIAASIMSKKLAAGSDGILLDVKTGSGAFMKTPEMAAELALKMTAIGEAAGKRMYALITDMDVPLGNCIGNALEVREAVETLAGNGPKDLTRLCVELAARMMVLASLGTPEECREKAKRSIADRSALRIFAQMVRAQGGDDSVTENPEKLTLSGCVREVRAEKDGWITRMNTQEIGMTACILGAGRETKDSLIDHGAGIILEKKTGDPVHRGEILAHFYTTREERLGPAEERFRGALTTGETPVQKMPMILAEAGSGGVHWYIDTEQKR